MRPLHVLLLLIFTSVESFIPRHRAAGGSALLNRNNRNPPPFSSADDADEPSDAGIALDEQQSALDDEETLVPAVAAADAEAVAAMRSSLKSRIFAACAASDRGFAASPADRSEIEQLLADISPLSPTEEPSRGIATGAVDAPLRACWRLVYTSASDVSSLGASPLAAVGGIYQDARELPVIVNVIDLSPRLLQNLPPSTAMGLATASRLKVTTRARPRPNSGARVGLSFEAVQAEPLAILGQDPPAWLAPLKFDLPQLGLGLQRSIFGVSEEEDPRDAESNPAFFDITYLDEDFLVIQQGSPGGMFAAVKVPDLAK